MDVASIVLCAGKGERMGSALSKMLHSVCGRPLCFWPLRVAAACSDGDVIAVLGHQKEGVRKALEDVFNDRLVFAVQEEQKGTAHAVDTALLRLKADVRTILVFCGDTPLLQKKTISELCERRAGTNAKVAMLSTHVDDPSGYGRIVRDERGKVIEIVEDKETTAQQEKITEINPGVYAFDAEFLKREISRIRSSNSQHEFYLTDLIKMASATDSNSLVSLDVPFEDTLGVNDKRQLAVAEKIVRKRIVDEWMKKGVTCRDPDTVYLDESVVLGSDVTIDPQVMIRGKSEIAQGVTIGTGCVLTDSHVKQGATILPYSVCDRASISENAVVGPFAHLRPGAVLGKNSKVGNFVEVKNTRLGEGAKASHLAYLGDALVGDRVNIGAGTITCNYDGVSKHATEIGENVFIGSNSTLVAPVLIGRDAYVAAGSTINRDVEPNALAIARKKQENKNEYAHRVRQRLSSKKRKEH